MVCFRWNLRVISVKERHEKMLPYVELDRELKIHMFSPLLEVKSNIAGKVHWRLYGENVVGHEKPRFSQTICLRRYIQPRRAALRITGRVLMIADTCAQIIKTMK